MLSICVLNSSVGSALHCVSPPLFCACFKFSLPSCGWLGRCVPALSHPPARSQGLGEVTVPSMYACRKQSIETSLSPAGDVALSWRRIRTILICLHFIQSTDCQFFSDTVVSHSL